MVKGERLVLNFHGVGSPIHTIPSEELPFWCAEERFCTLLDSLGDVTRRTSVPIELTFDDGNMSDATIALPELRRRGLSAAFFVCAGRIGQPGYLDEAGLRELVGAKMRVGSHGWGHVDWRGADDATLDQEIDRAQRALTGITGIPMDELAIPFGLYNRKVLHRIRGSAFTKIFTSDGGRAPLQGTLIPREAYETWWGDHTIEDFASRTLSPKARLRRSVGRKLRRLR